MNNLNEDKKITTLNTTIIYSMQQVASRNGEWEVMQKQSSLMRHLKTEKILKQI